MNLAKEYRVPLLTGAGALVVALLLWVILVSPQNSKLSNLRAQETQLQGQQTELLAKLTALKTEQQKLSSSCADLQKIATQIPSVQSPTDIDAEESSFESQFNALATSSGVNLTQFSGFAPATTATVTPTTHSATTKSIGGVVAVPTTLTVTGDYGQTVNFVNGLDSFPRLFVVQRFVLSVGTAAASASSSGASATPTTDASAPAAPATPTAGAQALWVGGAATVPTASLYSVAITGSIYYTTQANALAACTTATATTTTAAGN